MSTKLAFIALSGFALSVAGLGAAAALDAGPLLHRASFGDFDLPRCDFSPTGHSATRNLAWDGSDSVGIAVPATVHYHRGQGDQLVVTGDSALVPHVQIVDGSVRFDCRANGLRDMHLDVKLPGRVFQSFSIAGVANMTLENIDQPALQLHIAGTGNIAASGKASDVELHVAGAGDAKLASLAADRVAVHIAGSSNVDVAPRDDLDVHIAGSSTVTLHSEPRNIQTHITGSGRIIHADGSMSSHRGI